MTGTTFIGFSSFTLAMPFLPLYIRQLGVSDVGEIALWTGATLGITPALSAVVSPFWGRLADRFGRKIMVARSLVSCAAVMATMAFVTRPWEMLALRAILGFLTGYGALMLTMAADSAPHEDVASAIGRVQTAQRLGPAVGPAIGGVLAGWLGLRPAFLAAAGLYVVALLLVLALYDEQVTRASDEPSPARGRAAYLSLLSRESFVLLMAAVFATQFVDRSMGPILALYIEQLGVSQGRVAVVAGMLFSLMAVCAAVGHHVCSRFLRRYPAHIVISAASGTSAIGAVLLAGAVSPWMVAAGAALFGAGSGTAITAIYTTASGLIPRGSHGTGFGLLSSASLIGIAISPVVAGLLGATSLRGVFALDLIVLVAIALVVRRRMAPSGIPG